VAKIEKEIKSVSINYKDGTKEVFDYYAVVGHSGDTWFNIIHYPAGKGDKITMNNYLVALSSGCLQDLSGAC